MAFKILLPGKTGPTIWALERLLGLLPCNGSDKRHSSTRVGWSVQRWDDGLVWYGERRLSRRDQPQPVFSSGAGTCLPLCHSAYLSSRRHSSPVPAFFPAFCNLLSAAINSLAMWMPIGGPWAVSGGGFLGVGTCWVSGGVPGLWIWYLSGGEEPGGRGPLSQ